MQRLLNKGEYYFSNGSLGTGVAYISPWTPAALGSSLKLWLDANDSSTLTLSGSSVSSWSDKSGTGNTVTNATSASQPTYQATGFNSKPSVFFDASDDFLGKSSVVGLPNTGDLFYGAAFRFNADSGIWRWVVGHRSAANSVLNGSIGIQRGGGDSQIGTHNVDVSDTRIKVDVTSISVNRIATMGRAGGTNGNGGTVKVTATAPSGSSYLTEATQTWTTSSGSFLQIGGRQQSGTGWCNAAISEVIACNRDLTTTERQKFEGYLAHKWGLTASLPSDHPYKSVIPTA
jgi:hypothetical protein